MEVGGLTILEVKKAQFSCPGLAIATYQYVKWNEGKKK